MHTRDAEQAYLQADMKGTPVYIMLPQELWTDDMWKMDCPVFRFEKALYGHKHSGKYWQEFCHEQCLKADFALISESWPCVYWNEKLKLLLIVYVDDMQLSGPVAGMAEAWARLGDHINLEQQKGD